MGREMVPLALSTSWPLMGMGKETVPLSTSWMLKETVPLLAADEYGGGDGSTVHFDR
jgi:hypothetical protein